MTKAEIDEIEVEAAEIRRKNFNIEYWNLYYEQNKDDKNNIVMQIFDEAIEDGRREYMREYDAKVI